MNYTIGTDAKHLSPGDVMQMLADLGARLRAKGLIANVHVVGGAAIALTLDDHRLTQDVDALVLDHTEAFESAAHEVARKHGVQHEWIGDDISDFVANSPEGAQTEIALPGLNVFVASPEHLLAMKVRAATTRTSPKDAADLAFLAEHLGLKTADQVAELTHRQFADGVYRDRIGYDEYLETVEDVFMVYDLEHDIDPMLRWGKRQDSTLAQKTPPSPVPNKTMTLTELKSTFPELYIEDEPPLEANTGPGLGH